MIKTNTQIIHLSLIIKYLVKYKYQLYFQKCKKNSLKICNKMNNLCNIYAAIDSKSYLSQKEYWENHDTVSLFCHFYYLSLNLLFLSKTCELW